MTDLPEELVWIPETKTHHMCLREPMLRPYPWRNSLILRFSFDGKEISRWRLVVPYADPALSTSELPDDTSEGCRAFSRGDMPPHVFADYLMDHGVDLPEVLWAILRTPYLSEREWEARERERLRAARV